MAWDGTLPAADGPWRHSPFAEPIRCTGAGCGKVDDTPLAEGITLTVPAG